MLDLLGYPWQAVCHRWELRTLERERGLEGFEARDAIERGLRRELVTRDIDDLLDFKRVRQYRVTERKLFAESEYLCRQAERLHLNRPAPGNPVWVPCRFIEGKRLSEEGRAALRVRLEEAILRRLQMWALLSTIVSVLASGVRLSLAY